jgi:hypothetical protein
VRDQRPAQVQSVGGLDDLGTTYRRWANDDVDRDGVDLGVVVDGHQIGQRTLGFGQVGCLL